MFDIQIFKNNSAADATVHVMRYDNGGLDNTKLRKEKNMFYLGLSGSPRLTYFFDYSTSNQKDLVLEYINSNRNTIFSLYETTSSYITIVPNYDSLTKNVWLDYMDDGWINTELPYTMSVIGDAPTIICRYSTTEPTDKTYSIKYCRLDSSTIQYSSPNTKYVSIIGVDCTLSVPAEDDRILVEARGEYLVSSEQITVSTTGEAYVVVLEEVV